MTTTVSQASNSHPDAQPGIERLALNDCGALLRLKQVPLQLWERLTEAERVQLEALCARNRQADALERQRAAALGLPETLQQVAAWYRLRGDGLSLAERAALAEASRHAWSAVLAAMCAAGVGRKRRRSG